MSRLELLHELTGHEAQVWHASWNTQTGELATCGSDKFVKVWKNNESGWDCVHTLEESATRTIRCCEWSPNGKYLASVSFDSSIAIWHRANSKFEIVATLDGHENEVKSVSWNAAGTMLATCGRDKTVWIWEADSDSYFEAAAVLHGHTQDVKFVKWHPRDDVLASCSYDDTIRFWADNEEDWYNQATLTAHESTVWQLAFRKDGDRFVSCSDDMTLVIWAALGSSVTSAAAVNTWKRVCTLSGDHDRTIFSVDWSLDDVIVSGGADNRLNIYKEEESSSQENMQYVRVFQQLNAHDGDINCVRWCPHDSSLLVTVGDDAVVKLWRWKDADTSASSS